MSHLLYLIFRCDFDVMKNLENLEKFGDLKTPTVFFTDGETTGAVESFLRNWSLVSSCHCVSVFAQRRALLCSKKRQELLARRP